MIRGGARSKGRRVLSTAGEFCWDDQVDEAAKLIGESSWDLFETRFCFILLIAASADRGVEIDTFFWRSMSDFIGNTPEEGSKDFNLTEANIAAATWPLSDSSVESDGTGRRVELPGCCLPPEGEREGSLVWRCGEREGVLDHVPTPASFGPVGAKGGSWEDDLEGVVVLCEGREGREDLEVIRVRELSWES